jgi:cytochrome c-type biogenesis protein CcmH/NrfG
MSDIAEIAFLAYRNKKYRDSLELFIQVVDAEPANQLARLYLGMSYYNLGRVADAHRLFSRMVHDCYDMDVHKRVLDLMPALEAEMHQSFDKELDDNLPGSRLPRAANGD